MNRRLRAWLAQWGPVLPLLLAEATIWLGFGALLPILPIYFTQHGVDLPTLGVVVAAWPAARLIGEPFFGWLADRVARRPMMITGLVLASVFAVLPLFIVGPAAFILFRACSGMAAAMYDPAARAYLVDANPPERQGEAFGLYGAAQTGGFMLGPAIGGVLAAITGQPTVVFWVAGVALLVSAILVAVLVPEREHLHATDTASATAAAVAAGEDEVVDAAGWSRPVRLLNVLLVAAIMFNVGSYFAGGSYEVIWSLYMTSLGADLAAIGLTFFSFGLPPLLLSPFTGRFIDREGGFWALVVGVAGIGICGLLYPLVPEIWWMVVLGLVEGVAFALLSPAVFLLAARAAPPGRTSSAQGLLGGAGTVGTIVASLAAGSLAAIDLRYPFWVTGVVTLITLALGLAIGRRRLYDAMQPRLGAGPGGGRRAGGGRMTAPWMREVLDGRPPAPVVLVLGGFLTSPPLYRPLRRGLLERGAADVVVGGVWTMDWLLAASRGLGPILTRSGRALLEASRRSEDLSGGAPVLVIGHSAGGMSARLLTSPVAFAGRRLNGSSRIGAIVTLGTPARGRAPRRVAQPRRRRGGRVRQRRHPGTVLRAGDGVPRRRLTQGRRAACRLGGGASDLGRLPGPDAGARDRRDRRRRADPARVRPAPGRRAAGPRRRGARPGHRPRLVRLGAVRRSLVAARPRGVARGAPGAGLGTGRGRFDGSGDRR